MTEALTLAITFFSLIFNAGAGLGLATPLTTAKELSLFRHLSARRESNVTGHEELQKNLSELCSDEMLSGHVSVKRIVKCMNMCYIKPLYHSNPN